ncbi:MAG: hypothetical protein Q7U92_12895, partial [Bradyrhizobium sp.]|nr:hypothetical protein [Bradyrhizobium sp.]
MTLLYSGRTTNSQRSRDQVTAARPAGLITDRDDRFDPPVCLGGDSRIRGRLDRDAIDRKGRSGECEFFAPMTTESMR